MEQMDQPSKSSKPKVASTKVGKKFAQSAERKHDTVNAPTLNEPPSKFVAMASARRSAAMVQFLVCQVVTQ